MGCCFLEKNELTRDDSNNLRYARIGFNPDIFHHNTGTTKAPTINSTTARPIPTTTETPGRPVCCKDDGLLTNTALKLWKDFRKDHLKGEPLSEQTLMRAVHAASKEIVGISQLR